jgi:hypothetical protein
MFGQNDTITLANNDVLVGELKKMDRSVLTFSTSYDDTDFKIKWGKVKALRSKRQFIVSIEDGERVISSINSVPGKEMTVSVNTGNGFEEFKLEEVIFIEPIGKSFFARLTVDFDFGITVTKANNFKQLTTNLSATYLAAKWRSGGFYKTVISSQDGVADINRMDAEVSGDYYLGSDWFVQVKAIFLKNDEQLLSLRSTFQGGGGYYFIRNNNMYFSSVAGLANTNENFSSDDPDRNSTEAFVGMGFNKYDIGDLSVQTMAAVYPSLTQAGRIRFDFNFDMKYDLPLDLYIRLGLTYNYDNKPVEGASDSDYVFTTAFGWEWN